MDGRDEPDEPGHDGPFPSSRDAIDIFRKILFIIFVDAMFTTLFERIFTNVFDVIGTNPANDCLCRACHAD